MKKFSPLFFLSILSISLLITAFGCKRDKTDTNCGCNSTEIKYNLLSTNGTLSYFQNKGVWAVSYQPQSGNFSYYFPCNTNQDSLKAITQTANNNQVFQVRFSGKVKGPCPNENFGFTSGVTTFDYIILDSLKRY